MKFYMKILKTRRSTLNRMTGKVDSHSSPNHLVSSLQLEESFGSKWFSVVFDFDKEWKVLIRLKRCLCYSAVDFPTNSCWANRTWHLLWKQFYSNINVKELLANRSNALFLTNLCLYLSLSKNCTILQFKRTELRKRSIKMMRLKMVSWHSFQRWVFHPRTHSRSEQEKTFQWHMRARGRNSFATETSDEKFSYNFQWKLTTCGGNLFSSKRALSWISKEINY